MAVCSLVASALCLQHGYCLGTALDRPGALRGPIELSMKETLHYSAYCRLLDEPRAVPAATLVTVRRARASR